MPQNKKGKVASTVSSRLTSVKGLASSSLCPIQVEDPFVLPPIFSVNDVSDFPLGGGCLDGVC